MPNWKGHRGCCSRTQARDLFKRFSGRALLAIGGVALLLCALYGCTDHEQPALQSAKAPSDRPAPGTMVVGSVAPVELPPLPSLIRNGDFSVWPPRSAAPSGFEAPGGSKECSSIEPETKQAVSPPRAVRQTWHVTDKAGSFFRTFRTWATGLKPKTAYRFTFQADNQSQNTIIVVIYEYYVPEPVAPPTPPRGQRLGILEVPPTDGSKEFSLNFTTGSEDVFSVMFFVKTAGDGKGFPATCIWDDWHLAKAKTATPADSQAKQPVEE